METESSFVYGRRKKNYAAAKGYVINDGCNEFTQNVDGLPNCEACGCHRNFHLLKEGGRNQNHNHGGHLINGGNDRNTIADNSEGRRVNENEDDLNGRRGDFNKNGKEILHVIQVKENNGTEEIERCNEFAKKHRKSYTNDQVVQMHALANKLGWTTATRERASEIHVCCEAMGVEKDSFRIWMNNHKRLSRQRGTCKVDGTSH
ncbi:hypothetical protein RJ639_028002 [Escallonia herrerae]|uniref:ZF-HD dimerization-type domain-containing protein n=1 Tax=Escallonia herrerae TaxID=1293975 RepID=A0AA89BL66_9ASTE|nr:hypothetical protein RJ639_028002 [Escallonia herrerae]